MTNLDGPIWVDGIRSTPAPLRHLDAEDAPEDSDAEHLSSAKRATDFLSRYILAVVLRAQLPRRIP